ncbi:L,D-transpeptidase family protein [Allosphingosinicella sp.]|jgi:murein L,D-transpeptidase YcbB/YkuD|uniref:L,D-transpeptidase family protein n=1 Tax=Allosphingosinicella sp. TaxID=2823234 RepID=UPI002F0D4C06
MLKLPTLALCLVLSTCTRSPAEPSAPALLEVAAVPPSEDSEIAAFYTARSHRPLWTDSAAGARLLAVLAQAESDGLDPTRYRVAEIEAALRAGDPASLARADLLLSEGLVRYARDLRTLATAAPSVLAEQRLGPQAPPARALLEAAAAAPDRRAHAADARRLNAVYDGLRHGLEDYRRRWSRLPQVRLADRPDPALIRRRLGLAPSADETALRRALAEFKRVHGLPGTPEADSATVAALNLGAAHFERLIRLNMERARILPAEGRFVLVDAAAARLWMFEGERPAGTMRVIVGKQAMQTPTLAGRIRHAVLNPYWNVPVDLARQRARQVLRQGPRVLARERLQILSQFSASDRVLSASSVNWRAVAAGREPLRLRQLPGGANVMGSIKFMLPNNLDIYLHDFPDKSLFAQSDRRLSSGCVRLEDAPALARWLFGGAEPRPEGPGPEQRVELPEPVPVYITYLTAVPAGEGVAFQPDRYGRDSAALAALERPGNGRRRA